MRGTWHRPRVHMQETGKSLLSSVYWRSIRGAAGCMVFQLSLHHPKGIWQVSGAMVNDDDI